MVFDCHTCITLQRSGESLHAATFIGHWTLFGFINAANDGLFGDDIYLLFVVALDAPRKHKYLFKMDV